MGIHHKGIVLWNRLKEKIQTSDESFDALLKEMKHFSFRDYVLFHEYTKALHDEYSIRVVPLPQHWYVQQYINICKEYECIQGEPPPVDAGIYYVCKACKRFKGFVSNPKKRNHSYYARGHEKVLYDWETGDYYCAQKSCRSKVKKREYKNKRHKVSQMARQQRRYDEAMNCNNTKCIPVCLLGCMLQCYGKCYVLCPQPNCGRPCIFYFHQYKNGMFACSHCAMDLNKKHVLCAYCQTKKPNKKRWRSLYVEEETMYLCERHDSALFHKNNRTWLKKDLWQAIEKKIRKSFG